LLGSRRSATVDAIPISQSPPSIKKSSFLAISPASAKVVDAGWPDMLAEVAVSGKSILGSVEDF
jgi:hypothetical protein